jgi:hypothetical protein
MTYREWLISMGVAGGYANPIELADDILESLAKEQSTKK